MSSWSLSYSQLAKKLHHSQCVVHANLLSHHAHIHTLSIYAILHWADHPFTCGLPLVSSCIDPRHPPLVFNMLRQKDLYFQERWSYFTFLSSMPLDFICSYSVSFTWIGSRWKDISSYWSNRLRAFDSYFLLLWFFMSSSNRVLDCRMWTIRQCLKYFTSILYHTLSAVNSFFLSHLCFNLRESLWKNKNFISENLRSFKEVNNEFILSMHDICFFHLLQRTSLISMRMISWCIGKGISTYSIISGVNESMSIFALTLYTLTKLFLLRFEIHNMT